METNIAVGVCGAVGAASGSTPAPAAAQRSDEGLTLTRDWCEVSASTGPTTEPPERGDTECSPPAVPTCATNRQAGGEHSQTASKVPAYAAVDDPVELDIAVRELSRALDLVRQLADAAAEFPGVPLETVCGIQLVGSHVLARLIQQAVFRSLELRMSQQTQGQTEA